MGSLVSILGGNAISPQIIAHSVAGAMHDISQDPVGESKDGKRRRRTRIVFPEVPEAERASMHYTCLMQLPVSEDVDELLLNANTVYMRLQPSIYPTPIAERQDFRMVSHASVVFIALSSAVGP